MGGLGSPLSRVVGRDKVTLGFQIQISQIAFAEFRQDSVDIKESPEVADVV